VDNKEFLFNIVTPLEFTVRTTREYWHVITTMKHPSLLGRIEDVISHLGYGYDGNIKCFADLFI
jgi:hypothetical protein